MELSIVVPIYNTDLYLEECLDGLYNLKGVTKEVILVNDGSSDRSVDIIQQYQKKFPKITTVINKENGGVSSARNAGLEVVKGEYTYFIDSDDYINSKLFEELFNTAKKSGLEIITGRGEKFKGNTTNILSVSATALEKGAIQGKEFLTAMFEDSTGKSWDDVPYRPEVWDSIYKTSLLKENNITFKDGVIYEDELFTPQVYIAAQKAQLFDIKFYHYRQREGNITAKPQKESTSSRLYLAGEVSDTLFKNKISTVFSNGFLVDWCWKDRNHVNFPLLRKVMRMGSFRAKSCIKCILLCLYCIKNKFISSS